jgi:hypothetical protein
MPSLPTCEKSSLLFQGRWTRGDSATKFSHLSVIALKPQSRWDNCVVIETGCAVLDGLPRVCVVVCFCGSAICHLLRAGSRLQADQRQDERKRKLQSSRETFCAWILQWLPA